MTAPAEAILDLFAGPGGWSCGLNLLDLREVGVELDAVACATRKAAGHTTVRGDVAELDPDIFAPVTGLIASPPCQGFSTAGRRLGLADLKTCHQVIADLASGRDTRAHHAPHCRDPRSLLIVEPLRYTLALLPQWVALEQVPTVGPLFDHIAHVLRHHGYRVWTGELNAADYGVPQTRRRRILMASRTRSVTPPEPTHAPPGKDHPGLFGPGRWPWVTMAQALGLPPGLVTVTRGVRAPAIGGNTFSCDRPSWGLTEKTRSWVLCPGPRHNTAVEQLGPVVGGGHSCDTGRWPTLDDARPLTAAEAAALQGFPPGYPFQGCRTAVFRQIGDAVPPPMAAAIIGALLDLDWQTPLTYLSAWSDRRITA